MRYRLAILALLVAFLAPSCMTVLGALGGAGLGSLAGPAGTFAGGAAGAGAGHIVDENKRLKDENEELREKLENLDGLKREVTDLRSRLDKTRSAPPASGPLDLSYGPQVPWYERRLGWFTWKTWLWLAAIALLLRIFHAQVKYVVMLFPWAWLFSAIFGKKQSGTSPPLVPKLSDTAPPSGV